MKALLLIKLNFNDLLFVKVILDWKISRTFRVWWEMEDAALLGYRFLRSSPVSGG